ncbi:MAG: alpha/beta hydrolase-fold protein [Planctomycetota bacterium]
MKKRILLMALLSTPILALVAIFYAIDLGIQNGPAMRAQPVGPGAGDTGGANAIGEWLTGGAEVKMTTQRRGIESKLAEAEGAFESELAAEAAAEQAAPDAAMVEPERLPQGFTIVVRDLSDTSSDERPVFFASNLSGWNPADPRHILEPRSDMRWQIIFDEPLEQDGRVEFKFTLGSWDTVETDAEGENTENRTLPLVDAAFLTNGERPIFEMEVVAFRAAPEGTSVTVQRIDPYRAIDAAGTIRRVQVTGGAGGAFGSVRDLIVWLPEGYDDEVNAERTYPVLYLFDGQHLFETLPRVPGEWRADEAATRLIAAGHIEPIIIVGVPHMDAARIEEYVSFPVVTGLNADGERFARWFDREVTTRVERAFRVDTDRQAIGGASLGAAISMEIIAQHPGRFFGALLESFPVLTSRNDPTVWRPLFDRVSQWPDRVFIGMGGNERGDTDQTQERSAKNQAYVRWARTFGDQLKAKASAPDAVEVVIDPDAVHNEEAWAERFPAALRHLFGR